MVLAQAKLKQREVVAAREAVTAALADLESLRQEMGDD